MGKVSALRIVRVSYLASLVLGTLLLALSALIEPLAYAATPHQNEAAHIDVAVFKLPVTPISAQYYDRIIQAAEDDGATALVIELDSPGGLVSSMLDMVQRTLASKVPVVVYVSPQAGMAASAAMFIVYAGHIAAMAPNTTIGSSEVLIGGGDSNSSSTPETGDAAAERRKATNLLVSQIRSLADERGRNADFGEKAVRESANLHAQDALDQHVIDVMANDLNDLLTKIDGRKVKVAGEQVTLKTKGVPTNQLPLTFVEQVLLVITDPSVAFLLISLGTLGITWEFINPGAVFPGVVGAICLLVGLMALGTLPINAAGIAFILLAFVLFIADVFMPTHGILTAGGIASLIIGGLLLVNTSEAPGLPGVSPFTVSGVAVALGGFFFFAIYKVYRARKTRPTTGREGLVGSLAQTRTDLSPTGMVYVDGELWHATSENGSIPSGEQVRVVAAEGLQLRVIRETDA